MRSFRVIISSMTVLAVVPWIAGLRGQSPVATGGSVTIVRTDPHYQGTLLAGTATALLFRSSDGADSWRPLPFPGALRTNLHAVLIDPAKPHSYLVAVSSETPLYAGVFRTVDEGATWEQLSALRQKQVWSLASWAADGRVIAAGAQDGVYITRDGGETWTHISAQGSAGPRPVVSLAFDPANSEVLYAGTPHLAWKTTDGGGKWRIIHKGMEEDSDILSIDVDAANPRRLFVGACSGIYSSRDGGGTWASLERALGTPFRTYVVARAPRSASVVFAGTSAGLLQSQDGGISWRRLSSRAVRSIAFDTANRRMFVAADGGILRSEDGGSHFTEANQGLYDQSPGGGADSRASGHPIPSQVETVHGRR